MVKADFTRDYYADLELQPGATEAEIKKQFKKLALKYHPDRNPGREAEVNAKFQTINSAHEVLIDAEQRTKYDSQRARNSSSRSYATYGDTTTTASGTRGNPWSSAGSQWAPPPKPPPPRKPPPASAGAQRYANFANYATPNSTPPRPNSDAEARRKNWEAWENMKPPTRPWQPPKPVPKEYVPQSGREESNNAKHAPPPKANKPGYEEFRAGTSSRSERTSPSRPSTSNAPPRRNGFMPATPGGDEPPAFNASAYSSYRSGRAPNERMPAVPPEVPPRRAPPPDPLRQFREKSGTPYEPRLSTPYATHGGEKTNPFESINLDRSKSTRVPSERPDEPGTEPTKNSRPYERHRSASPPSARFRRNLSPEPGITRADSDINLGTSPKRTFSHANRSFKPNEPPKANQKTTVEDNTASDGDDSDSDIRHQSFGTRSRTFAKRRTAQTAGHAKEASDPSGKSNGGNGTFTEEHLRKPSVAAFQKWWWSTEVERNVLNDLPSDGQTSGFGTASRGPDSGKQEEPSMYASREHFNIPRRSAARQAPSLPASMEDLRFQFSKFPLPPGLSSLTFDEAIKQRPDVHSSEPVASPPHTPSGGLLQATPPSGLTPFEKAQFKLVDELITRSTQNKKLERPTCGNTSAKYSGVHCVMDKCGVKPQANPAQPVVQRAQSSFVLPSVNLNSPAFSTYRSSGEMGSPLKRHQINHVSYPTSLGHGSRSHNFTNSLSKNANPTFINSFSFNVDSKTFESSRPTQTAFTGSSTENISTTFTPEDWHGKFEAGDYFASDKAAANGASRARSGDRTRTKSPVKGRPATRSQTNLSGSTTLPSKIDTEIHQQTTDSEATMSPGGTKFAAEEWARTFSPQVFAPPPYPSGTSGRPSSRPRRPRTGSSTPRVHRTAGTAAMAAESSSEDSLLEMGSRRAQATATSGATQNVTPTTTDSPNAMDIDPPLDRPEPVKQPRENGASDKESSNEARSVPLEPSRPEWRSGDNNGADAPIPPVSSDKSDLHRRSANGRTFRRRRTKSWDEEDFKTTLEDLKNVEPLHHPATGLHSFADLTSNLPFPSQAASKLTIPRDFGSGDLALPHPPRAPMVPRIPEGAIRPTPSSWESYLLAFKAYMADWDIFNTQIIMHFVARRNQLDGMKNGWLEAFGNSDLDKYREGLKEDRKVREWWAVACEKHEAGMEEFQWFKNCLKDGVAAATAAAGK